MTVKSEGHAEIRKMMQIDSKMCILGGKLSNISHHLYQGPITSISLLNC
jgi:hypothetical protein